MSIYFDLYKILLMEKKKSIPWKTVKGTCLSLTVYILSDQMNSSDFFFFFTDCIDVNLLLMTLPS